jgi:prepilin-type N-terminal cleavage/methylation domain-containing protein
LATTVIGSTEVLIPRRKTSRGFSLLEVVISMAILTIGLVSLLGVFGIAMASTQDSQQDMIAKQLANEALESIVTARNTSQKQWSDIQNIADGGIFLPGYQPLYDAGADGIMGTADDYAAGYQKIHEPGPDGIYGTSDDILLPMSNYQRKIEIQQVTDANGNVVSSLRAINISVQFNTPRVQRTKTYLLTSFISQFR